MKIAARIILKNLFEPSDCPLGGWIGEELGVGA